MKKNLVFILLLLRFDILLAQERSISDTLALQGNKDMAVDLNEPRDYAWLIKTLSKSKYPVKLQEKNDEGVLRVAYEVNNNGYIINPRIVCCNNQKFKMTTLDAFKNVSNVPTTLKAGKDTLLFQYKLDTPRTSLQPHADILIIGYTSSDVPVLMRYGDWLIAPRLSPGSRQKNRVQNEVYPAAQDGNSLRSSQFKSAR